MIAHSPAQPAPPSADRRLDDLAEIIAAYNDVTEKLQHSHEALESEVARLRVELEAKNAQLERSKRLAALGEMAAGIAHEVRNPLAAIQLYAGMAGEDIAAVEGSAEHADLLSANDSVRKIALAVQGLSGIVNDVLAFAGQAEPQKRKVLASDLLDRAVQVVLPAVEDAGVCVVRRDLASPEVSLFVDSEMLGQAVVNLLRNAIDAMAEADALCNLTLDAIADDAGVTLVIADTGPGIPAEDLDRIFNPFYTTRSTGTGLGLAIVHRIVDAHGGTIRVRNQNAEPRNSGGAVFEMFLPREGSVQ